MISMHNNNDIVLSVKDVWKSYGSSTVLAGVTAKIARGSALLVEGLNGAGKTTLLNIICNITRSDRGTVLYCGCDCRHLSLHQLARHGVVRTFQRTTLPWQLRVFEYLSIVDRRNGSMLARVRRLRTTGSRQQPRDIAADQLREWGLDRLLDRRCDRLSIGEARLVMLIRALASKPTLLVMDEPTLGVHKRFISKFVEELTALKQGGTSMCIVSHDFNAVSTVADEVLTVLGTRQTENRKIPPLSTSRLDDAGNVDVPTGATVDEPALRLKEVAPLRSSVALTDNLSIDLRPGELLAVFGPNGSGKSTLLRSISGLHASRAGSISVRGTSTDDLPAHEIARLGVGLVLQGARVPRRLMVEQAVRLAWELGQRTSSARPGSDDHVWSDCDGWQSFLTVFPTLARRRRVRAGLLSGGEQQLLAVTMASARRPNLLLLDEPSAALHQENVELLYRWLRSRLQHGLAAVVVEQLRDPLSEYAHHQVTIDQRTRS